MTWDVIKTLEMGTYTTDLEIANIFQYWTIWVFGRLCVFYLKDAPTEYRWALNWAGLQGVYLYVIMGTVRSCFTLAIAILGEFGLHKDNVTIATLREKVMSQVGPVFTVATLLCVFNMYVLGKMADIRANLGSANLKFQATRGLVLISQIQLQVLMGLTVNSSLYNTIVEHENALPQQYQHVVQDWDLSPYRAKLMHAALLNYECLLVVLFNRWVWGTRMDFTDADAREVEEEKRSRMLLLDRDQGNPLTDRLLQQQDA